MEAQTASAHAERKFVLWIGGVVYTIHQESLTGAEIKQLGGIPTGDPLVQELENGTEVSIGDTDRVPLETPGQRFMRSPRFKRGVGNGPVVS
jgi:hypothetical protein